MNRKSADRPSEEGTREVVPGNGCATDGVESSMRPIAVTASLVVVLAACEPGEPTQANPAEPTPPPPAAVEVRLDGHLVFSAEGDVWSMDADGSDRLRLTDHPAEDFDPTWSPDGTRIAFQCTMGDVNATGIGDFEICVVLADGTGLRRLTDTPGENTQPAWSPDGEWIAFESNRLGWPSLPSATPAGYDPDTFGDTDVWIMRPAGSEQRDLTRNPMEDESFPAWSPDGAWIVVSRYGALHVVSPAGDRIAEVENSPGTDAFPDWTG